MFPQRFTQGWNHAIDLDILGQVTPLSTASRLLDVGCGPYDVGTQILKRHPRVKLIALEAEQQPAPTMPRLCAIRADARQIPLGDHAVDISYARFLLQHVPEPLQVLRGMARVTRPGGSVAAMEVDEGAILLHPQPPEVRQQGEAFVASLATAGKDRFLGRRLKNLLLQAGLKQVGVQAVTLTTEQVSMEAFWHLVMTRRGFSAEVPDWAKVPGAFGCIVLFLGWGTVS